MRIQHPIGSRFGAAILALLLIACSPSDDEKDGGGKLGEPGKETAATPAAGVPLPSFVELVKQQGPAVVNVSATRAEVEEGVPPGLREGDPFYEFFRRFGPPAMPGEPMEGSLGSGFIISEDGFILTNAHVIADTDEVSVKLVDKREYTAKVIGTDAYTDIALLKIDAKGLPVARIGDPQRLEAGEWVAAIGAPFGFENSVTVGVVSAKGRMLPNESYVPFIQTDVAVNPGNSGGPLFSTSGEVIGVNSQIYSETGGYMGISFAIPIDIAIDVSRQLRQSGKVTRGRIGVQVQELTVDLASGLGLKEPRGALVAAVLEGGPAAKAGIRSGDVVLSLGDQQIENATDLARFVAGTKPGSTVTAKLWRKGDELSVKMTVDELAEQPIIPQG
jgi:serine protease Do